VLRWLKEWKGRSDATRIDTASQCLQLCQIGSKKLANADLTGAEECFRTALAQDSQYALGYLNLALVLIRQGEHKQAFTALTSALALDPNNADGHYMIGGLYEQRFDLASASRHFQWAFGLNPSFEMACRDACRVLFRMGQIVSAKDLIAAGIALNPSSGDFHFYEGNLHFANDALESALESYSEAIALGLDSSTLHGFMGGILLKRSDIGSALLHLQRAIELDSNNTEAHHDIGVAHILLGNVAHAVQHQEIAIAQDPGQLQAYSCLLFALSSDSGCTHEHYLEVAHRYAEQVRKTVQPLVPRDVLTRSAQNPLRVGWVSGDFRKHVNMAFLKHLLVNLSKSTVELIAFSNNPYDDAVTEDLRPLMRQWYDISHLGDHEAAALIHTCAIDILIDLSGHTAHNRLPIFAWRPARVQVSWLGYFASTGLAEMDYLIADSISVPAQLRAHFSERIWYLPETRLCMTPPQAAQALVVTALPAIGLGRITFGCFQTLSKINDRVLHAWGQILARVPGSHLRLQLRNLHVPGVREAFVGRLLNAYIAADRVTLLAGVTANDYMIAHRDVDIILDTFPYPGGTTTAEALWMGVPTVTLAGNSLLARQGASMLQSAGLPDWIADDAADYVERAIGFASNTASLASLRGRLRQQVLASPLFDTQRFSEHFLSALREMHGKQSAA
jgi:protein O-GlcNAc transferase